MIGLTVVDLRVQMVLGCLGAEHPPFSQGALQEFRERLIAADLDRRVLERTVALAKATKAFDSRKLPKTLRVAIDSSPLEGAGQVEDTFNLLAHAARKVVSCAAGLLGWTDEQVCRQAGIPLLMASSIKRGLDIDWNDGVDTLAVATDRVLESVPGRWTPPSWWPDLIDRSRWTPVAWWPPLTAILVDARQAREPECQPP
jgi:hypothetical protein